MNQQEFYQAVADLRELLSIILFASEELPESKEQQIIHSQAIRLRDMLATFENSFRTENILR